MKNLQDLQNVDMRIRKLLTRLEMIPKEQARLKQDIENEKNELQTKKERSQQASVAIKNCESKTAEYKGQISGLEKQSSMVKNNDQYKAMLNEIQHLKDKISDVETREIELLDEQEAANAEFQEISKRFQNEIDNLNDEIAELSELADDIKEQIKALSAQRPELKSKVSKEALAIYERLLAKKSGTPAVALKDNSCGNCHLKIIPQTFNNIKAGKVTVCDYCAHLLYLP